MSDTKHDSLMSIGKSAYESIVEMVDSLDCDYGRLEELRDERDGFEFDEDVNTAADGPNYPNNKAAWEGENPDDAEELKELEDEAGECGDREDAEQRIQEDALSVRVFGERIDGEWQADKFELLLTTGGPAVRIMGELDDNCEPDRAWLEVQDWGTPWTQYFPADQDTLLAYARCFYFGE